MNETSDNPQSRLVVLAIQAAKAEEALQIAERSVNNAKFNLQDKALLQRLNNAQDELYDLYRLFEARRMKATWEIQRRAGERDTTE